MTTTTPANRPVVGILIALAGLLATLSIIAVLAQFSLGGIWIGIIVDAALTLAFLFLFIGRASALVSRVFFAVATIGWAILTVGGLITLGVLFTIGLVLALAGTLISGILAIARHTFSRIADVVFLLASIAVALILFNQLVPYLVGTIAIIVAFAYAVLLLLAGIFITARR